MRKISRFSFLSFLSFLIGHRIFLSTINYQPLTSAISGTDASAASAANSATTPLHRLRSHPGHVWVALIAVLLSGCRAFTAADTPATLRAEGTAYQAEATTIAETAVARQVEVFVTSQAASTALADLDSINRQLIATARVVIPPTPGRQVGVAPGAVVTPGTGISAFINTVVSGSIRDSDGCPDDIRTQFPTTIPRIYASTTALSVTAGTTLRASWSYAGQVVTQDTYTVPTDQTNFCIWFFIDSAVVSFTPGEWSVTLSANDTPIQPSITFTIQ